MAMTVSLSANAKPHDQYGQVLVKRFRYTGPASYPSGGDPTTLNGGVTTTFGLGGIVNFPVGVALDANKANARLLVYDATNKTVRWFVLSTNLEVAAAVDLSGFTADLEVTGF